MATAAAAVPLHVVSLISQSRVGERGGCRDACLQISALSSSWPSGERGGGGGSLPAGSHGVGWS